MQLTYLFHRLKLSYLLLVVHTQIAEIRLLNEVGKVNYALLSNHNTRRYLL